LALSLGSPSFLILTWAFLFPVVVAYLKLVEERELEARFGEAYLAYKRECPSCCRGPGALVARVVEMARAERLKAPWLKAVEEEGGMIEIRLHGRGGQGVWTAANLLAMAAIREGKHAQSFPFFGPERMGAPIVAFARISDEPIRIHSMIYRPDVVGVLDPRLLGPEVVEGLKENSMLIVDTEEEPETVRKLLGLKPGLGKIWTLDASGMAMEVFGRAITNTAIVAAIVRATGITSLDSLLETVKKRFRGKAAEKNVEIMRRAYEGVRSER